MTRAKSDPSLKQDRQDLDLWPTLAKLDSKQYDYWDSLTEEQRRKFVPYMYTHWMSSVDGNSLLQSYVVQSVNFNANQHLFHERVSKHPQLQWLMLCASSPGLGKQKHTWLPHLHHGYVKLQRQLSKKDAMEYFTKVWGSGTTTQELAAVVVDKQNHEYRLAKLYPHMKIDDVTLLATLITSDDLDQYDRDSGK
jgi:hypothetical protein